MFAARTTHLIKCSVHAILTILLLYNLSNNDSWPICAPAREGSSSSRVLRPLVAMSESEEGASPSKCHRFACGAPRVS